MKPVTCRDVHRTRKSSVKSVISLSYVCHAVDTPISTVTSLRTNFVTFPQFHGEEMQVMQEMVQDMAVDNVYTSPTGKHNGMDTDPPDTDVTLPVPTHMLAVQFEQI